MALLADRDAAVAATELLASVGLFISTLELLFNWRQLQDGGLFSWSVLGSRYAFVISRVRFALGRAVLGFPGILAVLGIRLLALILLVSAGPEHDAPWLGLIAVSLLLVNYRHAYGQDGSDNMFTVVYVTLWVNALLREVPGVTAICLAFIAFQTCLSYATAGMVKILGPVWRKGEAVLRIFSTRTYGQPSVARVLARRPAFSAALTWSVVVVETTFPLVLLLPWPYCGTFLIWGIAFHAINALVMGLNSFFWAFVATYPAILYCNAALGSAVFR